MDRSIETILAQAGACWDKTTGAVSMPVYQTATFRHQALGKSTGYDYTRSGNPNRAVLEETMALLEGGQRGLAFSSGMAAIDCLLRLLKPGDTMVATEDPYGNSPPPRKRLSRYGDRGNLRGHVGRGGGEAGTR